MGREVRVVDRADPVGLGIAVHPNEVQRHSGDLILVWRLGLARPPSSLGCGRLRGLAGGRRRRGWLYRRGGGRVCRSGSGRFGGCRRGRRLRSRIGRALRSRGRLCRRALVHQDCNGAPNGNHYSHNHYRSCALHIRSLLCHVSCVFLVLPSSLGFHFAGAFAPRRSIGAFSDEFLMNCR